MQMWSHCWTYLLNEGDRMGQDSRHMCLVTVHDVSDQLSRLRPMDWCTYHTDKLDFEHTIVALSPLTPIITCKCSSDYDSICPVGHDIEECRREVDLSIQRLFYWGAYTDKYKYGGQVQVRSCDCHLRERLAMPSPPTPLILLSLSPPSPSQQITLYGCTVLINEPVGVIGIACPDKSPCLHLSLSLPLLLSGATPSSPYPVRSARCQLLTSTRWIGERGKCVLAKGWGGGGGGAEAVRRTQDS